MMIEFLRNLDYSGTKTIAVLCAVAAVAGFDLMQRIKHKPTHMFFAVVVGTALSIGLIRVTELFLQPGVKDNPYAAAIAVVLVLLGWRSLFGPWEVQTKALVLASFLFWISLHIFGEDSAEQQSVRLIAAATALVPAAIWCMLFLKYHHERIGSVLLLFLAGMLSTVPILFYDALVRRGIEMQFFLFTFKPESFSQTTQTFVNGQLTAGAPKSVLIATFLSFLFVGVIEEVSKYWVLSRSGKQIFTSIDDVMQLSVIVAIGFAFAENIINPVYFTSFVREYLLHGSAPDILGFVSNILGRSVLTSMVHILSTGVMGYFLGLAIFAGPLLAERKTRGKSFMVLRAMHRMFRLKEVSIFRVQMLIMGLLSAIALHGLFNFLVTLPELLPNNPRSIADVVGSSAPVFLKHVPFLLVPALMYVVGGFWLLTTLFLRKENMVERGHLLRQEEFVPVIKEA